jgi:hypothetical protein
MPISYAVDAEHKIVVGTATDFLTDAELLDYGRRLRDDVSTKLGRELFDVRGVTDGSGITSAGIRRLATFWASLLGEEKGDKLAILAPADAAFSLGRMYQLLREEGPDSIRVFRDEAEARAWLAD